VQAKTKYSTLELEFQSDDHDLGYGIFFKNNSTTGKIVVDEAPSIPTPSQPSQAPTPSPVVNIEIGDSPVKGDANAPVTLVEFSDYECPFCGRHFQQTYPQIISQYVDTGKVKIVFKDFPLSFHPQAQKAAEAARCFREQKGDDGYFKYHDYLYKNQQSLSIDNYKKWARDLGADGPKFDTCLDSNKFRQAVIDSLNYGQQVGVQGTPGFFINGKSLSGAQPYSAFRQLIEESLQG